MKNIEILPKLCNIIENLPHYFPSIWFKREEFEEKFEFFKDVHESNIKFLFWYALEKMGLDVRSEVKLFEYPWKPTLGRSARIDLLTKVEDCLIGFEFKKDSFSPSKFKSCQKTAFKNNLSCLFLVCFPSWERIYRNEVIEHFSYLLKKFKELRYDWSAPNFGFVLYNLGELVKVLEEPEKIERKETKIETFQYQKEEAIRYILWKNLIEKGLYSQIEIGFKISKGHKEFIRERKTKRRFSVLVWKIGEKFIPIEESPYTIFSRKIVGVPAIDLAFIDENGSLNCVEVKSEIPNIKQLTKQFENYKTFLPRAKFWLAIPIEDAQKVKTIFDVNIIGIDFENKTIRMLEK
jgi:hypothetical protein